MPSKTERPFGSSADRAAIERLQSAPQEPRGHHEVVLEEETMGLRTPKNLDEELVRLFFGYLGIDDPVSSRA